MESYEPILADLRSKYFDVFNKRRAAKLQIEECEKTIVSCEAEFRKMSEAWNKLRELYPTIPELDNREAGIFNSKELAPDITPAQVKDWIEVAIRKSGRFISKGEIFRKMIELFAKEGLNKDHMDHLSQTLKVMLETGRLVNAKGDHSNHSTYWGVKEFAKHTEQGWPCTFVTGREPVGHEKITMWDFRGIDE